MLLFIGLLFLLITELRGKFKFESFLYSVVIGVAMLWGMLEGLSLIRAVSMASMIAVWALVNIVLLAIIIKYRRSLLKTKWKRFTRLDMICSIPLLLIAFLSFYIALTMTPINYDSMTYHLARVAHWANHESVEYYATHIIRQLTSPMLSEYVMLNYYVLLGENDILVNLVQCFSYIINAFIIWHMTAKLGASKGFRYLATLIYMTTPIILAESVTTQNDLFAAMWLLIFVDLLIGYWGERKLELNRKTVMDVVIMAICIAFGYLSKPNVCIAMLLFVFVLAIASIRRKDRLGHVIAGIIIAACTMTVFLVPYFARNYSMLGTLTADITGARQLVGTTKPDYVTVNFVKNYTYNLPNVVWKESSEWIKQSVTDFSNAIGVDLNDPSIAEDGGLFMVQDYRVKSMDSAVNPLFIVLFTLFAIPAAVYGALCRKKSSAYSYIQASTLSLLIFLCVLRWEPYITRYMVGYFALLSVTIALTLQSMWKSRIRLLVGILVPLICLGCFSEFYMTANSTVRDYNTYPTREECYFTYDHGRYEIYHRAAEYIEQKGYQKVGFWSAENYYDYPFMKMLRNDTEYAHIDVYENASGKYEDLSFQPDCILLIANRVDEDGKYRYHGTEYRTVFEYEDGWVSLVERDDT